MVYTPVTFSKYKFLSFYIRAFYIKLLGTLPHECLVKNNETVIQCGCWRTETMENWSNAVGPSGKVVIIEADPQNYKILQIEQIRRRLHNVVLVNNALWKCQRRLTLQVSDFSPKNKLKEQQTYCKNQDKFNYDSEVQVNADCLDHILVKAGITSPDHIQLTISGGELDALEGMNEIIKPGMRVLIRSILLIKNEGKVASDTVLKKLKHKGFIAIHGRREKNRSFGGNIYAIKK